jgi:hypothetical protein
MGGRTPDDPQHGRGEHNDLDDLMTRQDRSDPLEEATYAALETVQLLLRAQAPPDDSVGVQTELTREALAAARAVVAATAYSLVRQTDAHRALREAE